MRITGGTLPLLLFLDPRMVYPVNTDDFQFQAVHCVNKQNLQLGLRKAYLCLCITEFNGNSMLRRCFRLFSSHMSLQQIERRNRTTNSENVLSHRKQSLHGFSLRLLGLFVVMLLVRRRDCQYLAFNEAHMELQERFF